jgi:hypothetical protein
MKHREIAYALMRITLGVVFLFYGIGKFMGGIGNFVGGMNQQFSGKLPAAMVMPFAYAIPFAETISGALIFFGLFTRVGLNPQGRSALRRRSQAECIDIDYILLNFRQALTSSFALAAI